MPTLYFFALLMPGYQFLFCLVNFCVWKFWKSLVLETAGRVTVKTTCFALRTDLIKRCVNFVSPHISLFQALGVHSHDGHGHNHDGEVTIEPFVVYSLVVCGGKSL